MAKLYFRHGAMGASKTANALMVGYNYEERGQKVLFMKPAMDKRYGKKTIYSRLGIEKEALLIDTSPGASTICRDVEDFKKDHGIYPSCVIIDEAQFLSRENVEDLCTLADDLDIPVICYGLRADFQGNLFSGSLALFCLADSIEEIKTICWCGRKAIMNARIVNGRVVKEGEQIQLGGNESYISLCRKHWKRGELGEAKKRISKQLDLIPPPP